MSALSLAYIFKQQQLLVDERYQLPRVESLASDLLISAGDQVIARDLLDDESIPAGLQLVPIRQLLQGQDETVHLAQGHQMREINTLHPAAGT